MTVLHRGDIYTSRPEEVSFNYVRFCIFALYRPFVPNFKQLTNGDKQTNPWLNHYAQDLKVSISSSYPPCLCFEGHFLQTLNVVYYGNENRLIIWLRWQGILFTKSWFKHHCSLVTTHTSNNILISVKKNKILIHKLFSLSNPLNGTSQTNKTVNSFLWRRSIAFKLDRLTRYSVSRSQNCLQIHIWLCLRRFTPWESTPRTWWSSPLPGDFGIHRSLKIANCLIPTTTKHDYLLDWLLWWCFGYLSYSLPKYFNSEHIML